MTCLSGSKNFIVVGPYDPNIIKDVGSLYRIRQSHWNDDSIQLANNAKKYRFHWPCARNLLKPTCAARQITESRRGLRGVILNASCL